MGRILNLQSKKVDVDDMAGDATMFQTPVQTLFHRGSETVSFQTLEKGLKQGLKRGLKYVWKRVRHQGSETDTPLDSRG